MALMNTISALSAGVAASEVLSSLRSQDRLCGAAHQCHRASIVMVHYRRNVSCPHSARIL